MRSLELLSPASNAQTAKEAIKHGADAVYIGPPSHGARKAASNSIEDIEEVADFAHQYGAKVYATVNTIVYESEIKKVESLCSDLYHARVDALIVQDMGVLRMNLPPIALHASTQCDIRTPEKAKFLQEVGFSQLVLARELTLDEIRAITQEVAIPVETFIHGALCVSYSGRCHASYALTGRSANRGECSQICRYPYTLVDNDGKILAKDKYLLSLKDFNATNNLEDLIKAGVSSFKIEGRLKDVSYVKNITALYNARLNNFISRNPLDYKRSSYGEVELNFNPQAEKSFNRGFTNYFLDNRLPPHIASLDSPKSKGERVERISDLNNGDGISFYDEKGEFTGVNINRVEGEKIYPARKVEIPSNRPIYRTFDVKWEKLMSTETASRKLALDVYIDNEIIKGRDDMGTEVCLPLNLECEIAKKPTDYRDLLSRLGNTRYKIRNLDYKLDSNRFYKNSEIAELRRNLIEELEKKQKETYIRDIRREENLEAKYPSDKLDYRDNVANSLSESFYREHGVKEIEPAAEAGRKLGMDDAVMTTRHCILRELGMCKKKRPLKENKEPLSLLYKGGKFKLDFDCKNCEMKVLLP